MKKFTGNSFYPYIIIGLIAGGFHYLLISVFEVNRNFAFFGTIIAALIVYAIIVERRD